MLVVVRADATASTGVGHATRCLALAEELATSGDQIHWIGDLTSQPWLANKVSEISTSITEPVGSQLEQAHQATGLDPDLTIVDSYELGEAFCGPIQRHRTAVTALIDAASPLTPADMYVSPGVDAISRDFVRGTPILRGAEYVLIRRELRRIKEHLVHSHRRPGEIGEPRRVAVLLGGTDVANLAPEIVNSLISLDSTLRIDAAPRPMQPHLTSMSSSHRGSSTVKWWNAGEGIYSQIAQADLVISAAGVSSWEILYLGLPLALVQVADNQAFNYEWMTSQGHALGLGRSARLREPGALQDALRNLLGVDPRALRRRDSVVDGFGVQRVVRAARQLVQARSG